MPEHDFYPIGDLVSNYLDRVYHGSKTNPLPVPTGFRDLDRLTGGLYQGDLIVIASRPSVGKTSFALSIALNAAYRFAQTVGFFSLESSRHQITQRLLTMISGIDSNRMRMGRLSEYDVAKLTDASNRLSVIPLYIDDTPNLDADDLRARTHHLVQTVEPDLIIIDRLQLLSQSPKPKDKPTQPIPQDLKLLATEINRPVLVVSELSRAVDNRSDHIPKLSDLSGGRGIEDVADLILLMHREDYYYPDTERKGIMDLYVAKHRNGPTGMISMVSFERYVRFLSLSSADDLEFNPLDPECWIDPLDFRS